ncbi:MAG: DNA repair and recombination protein RadA, partial [Candidatus Bathycorpusculaceae bacterium]
VEMKLEEISVMTPTMAEQLRKHGIISVESLAIHSLSEFKLMVEKGEIENVHYDDLKRAFEEAWRRAGFWMMTAAEMAEIRGNRQVFTTGSKAVDDMLGGGIFSREMTEFVGEYGSGKSQFLFSILVEAVGRDKDATAIFIDTEDTFNEERIRQIAEAKGYDPDDIFKRIIYIPITDSDLFQELVNRLHITIETRNVKLIEIDSIIAVLRAEYVGREVLWLRQQILNRIIRRLLNLAKVYNIAVALSNQVVANPQAPFTYDPLQQKVPTGGTILGHNANTRLYLRKAGGSKRLVRLFDSSWRPEAECVVRISEKGIEDVQPAQKTEEKETEEK